MAHGADFDGCGRLDKNHAPVADPQSGAWPSPQALHVACSSLGKSLDLGLDVYLDVGRKLAKLATCIMGPCDRLHERNISICDYSSHKNIATSDIACLIRENCYLKVQSDKPIAMREILLAKQHVLRWVRLA